MRITAVDDTISTWVQRRTLVIETHVAPTTAVDEWVALVVLVEDDDFPAPLTLVAEVCLAAGGDVVFDAAEVDFAEVAVTLAATDVATLLTDDIADFAPADKTDNADWASRDLMESSLKTGSAIIKSSLVGLIT